MKGLAGLVKDGVLIAMTASTLAGAPNTDAEVYRNSNLKEINTIYLYDDLFSKDATKPEFSMFLGKDYVMPRMQLVDVVRQSFKEVRPPRYVTTQVQLARGYVESTNRPFIDSPAGARGLMQVIRESWADAMPEYPFEDAYNPVLNAEASNRHMNNVDWYLRTNYPGFDTLAVDKKLDLLNAGYNGGQGKLMAVGWDISKMPLETREYVEKMRQRTGYEHALREKVYAKR